MKITPYKMLLALIKENMINTIDAIEYAERLDVRNPHCLSVCDKIEQLYKQRIK